MNPYPPMSEAAQSLKYRPRRETRAYWGDGRFQLITRALHDTAISGDASTLFVGVVALRQFGSNVYVVGQDGYLVLDLQTGSVSKGHQLDSFALADRGALQDLGMNPWHGDIAFVPRH